MLRNKVFSSDRQYPWEGLSSPVTGAQTSERAMKLAGLDWQVCKKPLYCNEKIVQGKFGLVRDDTGDTIGICGNQYNIMQNKEAFDFVESLVANDVLFETAGCLDGGSRVFMSTKIQDEWTIGDDDIGLYLLLSAPHTGHDSLKVAVTPIRAICKNTLIAGLKTAKRSWNLRHNSTLSGRLEDARASLNLASDYMTKFVEFGNRAIDKRVSSNVIEKLVETVLFPVTGTDSDRARRMRENKMEKLNACYNMPDLSGMKGTIWGVLNAVSDYETHFKTSNRGRIMHKVLDGDMELYNKALEFLCSKDASLKNSI